MNEREIINEIVNLTERSDRDTVSQEELLRTFGLIESISDRSLDIYVGYLSLYYFSRFKELPLIDINHSIAEDLRFCKCNSILSGTVFSPSDIGAMFLDILSIPDEQSKLRDILLGAFFCSLWHFINKPDNFEVAVDYGVEIIKSAFNLDAFDCFNKIKLNSNNAKIISLAGSGKKKIKLLNVSSLSAIITAAVGKEIDENIIVEKTVSRATSSVTGSGDIFELVGVNLDIPISRMAEISIETRLGVFDINNIVPRLNHVYDGRLYNVQFFAGIVGGAALVCPIEVSLINYGLARGSNEMCLAILKRIYPRNNILVLSGKDTHGESAMDQVSVVGKTKIAQLINNIQEIYVVEPKDFSFELAPIDGVREDEIKEKNLSRFIKLLSGNGNKVLKQLVSMEVAFNLYGLGIVDNLESGAALASKTIDSGRGIDVLEDLVNQSGGDKDRFRSLLDQFTV